MTQPIHTAPASPGLFLHRSCGGFTLVELMIVVAVISILTYIAYPSYTSYVARGKIPDATATLSQLRNTLELYYQDNRNYGSNSDHCGGGTIPATSVNSNSQYFTYTCTQANGGNDQTYILTATGKSTMSGYTYTLDYQNIKQTTAFPNVTSTKNCWLLKSSDC